MEFSSHFCLQPFCSLATITFACSNPGFEIKASSANTILGWLTVAGAVGTMTGGPHGGNQAWISAGAVVQTLGIVPLPDVKYVFSVAVSAEDGWSAGRYRLRILSGGESMCEARGQVVSGAPAKVVSVSCWGKGGGGLILSLEGFRPADGPSEGSLVTFDDVTFYHYTPRCLKQWYVYLRYMPVVALAFESLRATTFYFAIRCSPPMYQLYQRHQRHQLPLPSFFFCFFRFFFRAHCSSALALDVVLAVDISGSARERAVDTSIEVVRQLDLSRVALSLVMFADEARIELSFNTVTSEDCSDASDIELEAVAMQAGLSAPNGCPALVAAAPIFCVFPVGLTPLASYCEHSCGRCAAAEGAVNAADVKGKILERLEGVRRLKLPNRRTNIGKALRTIARDVLNPTNGWGADPTATRVLVISDGLTNGEGETISSFAAAKLELTSLGVDLFSMLVLADPFSRFALLQDSSMDVGGELTSYFGVVARLAAATPDVVEETVTTMVDAAFCSPQPPPPPPQCACVCPTCVDVPRTVEPAGPSLTTVASATTNATLAPPNSLCGSAEAAECKALCSNCIGRVGQWIGGAVECTPCVVFCADTVHCLSPPPQEQGTDADHDAHDNDGGAVDDDSAATTPAAASVDASATTATPTATQCTTKANNCHTCNSDSSACTMCKNAAFLHRGVCIAACPSGTRSVGKGNFGKRCQVAQDMARVCVPGVGDCHTCSSDSAACTMCKNAAVLHNGACIEECPGGLELAGKGNFNLRCEQPAGCTPKANNCHACNPDNSACRTCRNAAVLHNGACVDACPDGIPVIGNGYYNLRCGSDGGQEAACTPKQGNCHTCNHDASACTLCKNALKVLYMVSR